MKKIEKLINSLSIYEHSDTVCFLEIFKDKINELINAHNECENNISEQISRFVDKLCKHSEKLDELKFYNNEKCSQKEKEGLLPCPFCGEEPRIILPSIRISCENTYCLLNPQTKFFKTINEAVHAWNTRI